MKAKLALAVVRAFCMARFPDDVRGMETTALDGIARVLDYEDAGSHKYLPDRRRLNEALGTREGAGIYGYLRFDDGSYLLRTCEHGLACWSGRPDEGPEFLPDEALAPVPRAER